MSFKTSRSITPLVLSLFLLTLLAIFIKYQYSTTIAPVPANASDTVFSSGRAFEYLEHLTQEQVPHPVDSLANRIVEQRIVSLLTAMGYQPELQESKICRDSERGFARCTKVRNIIVHIKGTSNNKGILLAAHYDSVPAGPGGSDAGAAVGTLLETARLLSLNNQSQPLNSIVLLFNEGEEFGLFGAKSFMNDHPLAKKLQLAINVEARGSTGKSVMFETGENSGWLVKHYIATTPAPLSSSLFYEVYKFLPNDTDLTIFKEHGLQGLNFAHADRLPHYHTPLDNLENLDRGSLQHHGDNVWGVLSQIKDLDLTNIEEGNLVYSDILGLFVVQWSEGFSLLTSIVLLMIFTAITYFYKTSLQLSLQQFTRGFLVCLAILITSAITALVILQAVQFLSGHSTPWHANSLPMQLSIWLSVLFSGLLVGSWLVKNLSMINMACATIFLSILLSIASSIWLTGISFLFLIPAIMGVFGFLTIGQHSLRKINHQQSSATKIETPTSYYTFVILMAIVTAIMFMPIAYVLELMVGFNMSIAIGLMLGFIMIALLPLLAINKHKLAHLFKLYILIGLLLASSIIWTSNQAIYSSWLPQRLNIQYVQDEQDKAFITTGFSFRTIPQSLKELINKNTKQAEIFPWSKRRFHKLEVSSQQHKLPLFTVITTEIQGTIEHVDAIINTDVRNSENAQLSDVMLYIPVESNLISIIVGSNTIHYQNDKSNQNGYYEYHCRGISCANIELSMTFEQENPETKRVHKQVIVMSAYSGIPIAFKQYQEARGDTAVPSQSGDRTIVFGKFEF